MIALHRGPHFTFRFADDRIIRRIHLEGVGAGRRVSAFELGSATGEDLLNQPNATNAVELAKGRKQMQEAPAASRPAVSPGRVPRVSRWMALALHFEKLLHEGHVARYSELARLGHVSNARISQIMNLLHLAPDIQEAILFLPRTQRGRDPVILRDNRGRTDLGEMAQMAAVETIVGLLGERTGNFFGVTPTEVRRELAKLHTVKQFGLFATAFFARFIYKALDYYLSRVLPLNVGEGRRFTTLEQLSRFSDALETHCREAARIVQIFTGEWTSATMWEEGRITRDDARDLAHGAVSKIINFTVYLKFVD